MDINLHNFGVEHCFFVGSKKLAQMGKTVGNAFWKEVIKLCIDLQEINNVKEEFHREYIWFNNHINIKSENYTRWVKKGILTIGQLLNNNGRFLSLDEFNVKFGLRCNFLEFNGVIKAIPREWKTIIYNTNILELTEHEPSICDVINAERPGKLLYNILIDRNSKKPIAFYSWNNMMQIDEREFKELLLNYKISITDLKLCEFQYKLLHRIVPCNNWLTKVGIKNNVKCDHCDEIEDIEHLFWDCSKSNDFIRKCIMNLNRFGFNIKLEKFSFLLGTGIANCDIVLFLIYSLIKYHLFKCKITEKQPNVFSLIIELKRIFELEKGLAIKKGKSSSLKFNYKWKNFLSDWGFIQV